MSNSKIVYNEIRKSLSWIDVIKIEFVLTKTGFRDVYF
jgi:hypothetical protein